MAEWVTGGKHATHQASLRNPLLQPCLWALPTSAPFSEGHHNLAIRVSVHVSI